MSPALPDIAVHYAITNQTVVAMTLSIYLLSWAFGPLLLAPLSEIYGRTWVCMIAVSCSRNTLTLGVSGVAYMQPVPHRIQPGLCICAHGFQPDRHAVRRCAYTHINASLSVFLTNSSQPASGAAQDSRAAGPSSAISSSRRTVRWRCPRSPLPRSSALLQVLSLEGS